MQHPVGNESCPKCGMQISTGDNPTTRDGETYCCEGCASGGVCTCSGHDHSGAG